MWGYSSVAEHSTADREVAGSTPAVPCFARVSCESKLVGRVPVVAKLPSVPAAAGQRRPQQSDQLTITIVNVKMKCTTVTALFGSCTFLFVPSWRWNNHAHERGRATVEAIPSGTMRSRKNTAAWQHISASFVLFWQGKLMRCPGIEPGSQEWESCMIPLHQQRNPVWRCRGSNPGPFTCEANALPLSHIPSKYCPDKGHAVFNGRLIPTSFHTWRCYNHLCVAQTRDGY